MSAVSVACPQCHAAAGQDCNRIGLPLTDDAYGKLVHIDRLVQSNLQQRLSARKQCTACGKELIGEPYESEYCGPRCWGRHHDDLDEGRGE